MELDTWESKAKVDSGGFTKHDRFVGNDYHGNIKPQVQSYDNSAMEMAINNERHLQANRKNSDLPF
jgi:hypothetical protein